MSLYLLQSLWEIWKFPNPGQAAGRIGANRQFGGKYNMASWDERGAFWRKKDEGGIGHRLQFIIETLE